MAERRKDGTWKVYLSALSFQSSMFVLTDFRVCVSFTVLSYCLPGDAQRSGNPPDGLTVIKVSPN